MYTARKAIIIQKYSFEHTPSILINYVTTSVSKNIHLPDAAFDVHF